MTQDERNALIAERAEKQRLYQKRKGVSGYGANAAALLERVEAIDALLDAPEQPSEPTETESLAGRVLGDPDASAEAKSLAGSVLARAGSE